MKLGFMIAYLVVAALLIVMFFRACRTKKKIMKNILLMMGFACACVLSNVALLAAGSATAADISLGVFFSCIDWLLLSMLWFVNDYCASRIERFVPKWIPAALCLADSLQLLANPLLHHAYTVRLTVQDGDNFWIYDSLVPFRLHLAWCYVLVAVIVAVLVEKHVTSPKMYRGKYLNIIWMLSLVVVLDAIHMFTQSAIDFSLLGFPVAAVAIYYYTIEYVPRTLVGRTLSLTADDMMDGVVIADCDNNAIYANERVLKIMGLDALEPTEYYGRFCAWCREHYQSPDENFVYDWTIGDGDERQYLKVNYRRFLDEDGKYVGSYLNVQERTKEIETLMRERYAATHDYLTGLYNREYFYAQAERCLRLHPDERYLMICSDIRNFKMINDIFGKEAADQLLVDMGEGLRRQSIGGEVYGRLFNDRFALLMRKRDYREVKLVDYSKNALKVADDVAYPLRVYMGVYEIDDPALPISVMCDRAQLALETIKGDYQKQVAYYDEKLRYSVLREQELAADFDRAIEEGQIELYIQPQIAADGGCLGGEGLVRWNHPTKGLLMPGEFVPSFERNGLIVKLDMHVWDLACRQLQKWKRMGFGDRYISVNISPKDFFFVDIFKEFTTLVGRYGISPKSIKLEITETAMMADLPKQLALVKKLRGAGFIVEMDDFGSGYSSLSMLKDIRVDVLKIDMDFLRKSENEERSRTILKTVVALSKELGMPVITEGVETKDHVDFLTQIGCDMFQGFFFARPMSVADYEKKYMKL